MFSIFYLLDSNGVRSSIVFGLTLSFGRAFFRIAGHQRQRRLFLVVVSALCFTAGCSSSPNVAGIVAQANNSNIKRAANLFGAAIARNDWRAPKDEAVFKEFIHNQMAPHKLEMMGIKPDAIDAIFVSDRDDKPFKFRYNETFAAMSTVPIVFEQQGINGLRQVAYNNGKVEEVDDGRYQQFLGGKAVAPAGERASRDAAK